MTFASTHPQLKRITLRDRFELDVASQTADATVAVGEDQLYTQAAYAYWQLNADGRVDWTPNLDGTYTVTWTLTGSGFTPKVGKTDNKWNTGSGLLTIPPRNSQTEIPNAVFQ